MPIRRLAVIVGFLLIPAVASADGHRAEIFFGLSFAEGSWLTGFHVSGEHLLKKNVFIVGDYSLHDGNGFKRHVTQAGAEVSKRAGAASLSGRLLLGGVSDGAGTDFSTSVGVGLQIPLPALTSPRAEKKHWAIDVRADYVHRQGDNEAFMRYSVGALLRIPRPAPTSK